MQRAKAFFYVSLGILALAISFHLGALSAQGQGVGMVAAASLPGGGIAAIDVSGTIWPMDVSSVGSPGTRLGPLSPPRSGVPAEVGVSIGSPGGGVPPSLSNTQVFVMYDDGDVWFWNEEHSQTWRNVGNVFSGGSVETRQTTWGRVKAERR